MKSSSRIEPSTSMAGLEADPRRRYLLALCVAALAAAAALAVLYLQTRTGQALWAGAAFGAAALLSGFAYARWRQGEALAGGLALLGLCIALAGSELAWEGATLYHAAGGALLVLLSGRILLRRWRPAAIYTLISLAALLLASLLHPAPRYAIAGSAFLGVFVPGLPVGLAGLCLVWYVLTTLRIISIRTRLLFAFILIALLPVAVTGAFSALSSAQNSEQHLLNQLESVATLKESEINTWVANLHTDLSGIRTDEEFQRLAELLLAESGSPEALGEFYRAELRKQFNLSIERTQSFNEIFIMNMNGRTLVSTAIAQEGKSFVQQALFEEGLKDAYTTPPFYSPTHGQNTLVVSQPVSNLRGEVIGVISGRAKMDSLYATMLERPGLGQTGETYLVSAGYVLLTPLISGEQGLTIRTAGSTQAVETRQNGSGSYDNAAGRRVIGVYHWNPQLQVGLMAEQDSREALASVTRTLGVSLAVIVASLLLAVVVALFITRSIANPIADLAQTTTRMASGNLGLAVKVVRHDEIGALATAFNSMALQLNSLIGGLEQRVADRTRDLERRSSQMRAAAEVARDITTTTGLDELMSQAVNLIRDRFGFYHAGLFLVDERGEYAVLQAATGEAGRQMLAAGHRLKVGEVGIVGYVTGSGKPRIALSVGADSVHFKNPILPHTRSEMALPLRVGKQVIGALDVQSVEEQAFDNEDVTVLQTMADQLAVAIQNARLIQQMDRTVQELEQAYGRFTQEGWRSMARGQQEQGYRYRQTGVGPASDPHPEAIEALQTARPVILQASEAGGSGESALAVPIKLRDQAIGVLDLRFESGSIPPATVALVEEAAARLALVMENARLLQEAQRIASREQRINLIAGEIRGSNNVEIILQNTVRELGRALGASRTYIQIGSVQGHEELTANA